MILHPQRTIVWSGIMRSSGATEIAIDMLEPDMEFQLSIHATTPVSGPKTPRIICKTLS